MKTTILPEDAGLLVIVQSRAIQLSKEIDRLHEQACHILGITEADNLGSSSPSRPEDRIADMIEGIDVADTLELLGVTVKSRRRKA